MPLLDINFPSYPAYAKCMDQQVFKNETNVCCRAAEIQINEI